MYLIICLLALAYPLCIRYGQGLHKIPGPFLASISSLWKFYVIWREDMPERNAALHRRHGPLVRIGPKHVSASSKEAIRAIYKSRAGFQKTSIYGILQPQLGGGDLHNVFSTQDPAFHASLKRLIGNLYSVTSVTRFEGSVDNCVKLLVERLKAKGSSGAPVDMSAWMQFYAFDCLGEINFSRKLGFLDKGTDIDEICALDHGMMMYFATMGQVPMAEKIWSWTQSLLSPRAPNPLFTFTLDTVNERLRNPTAHEDMLNLFLSLHEKDPSIFGTKEVIAAAYINVVTAHDVLAITLRAVLYYVARNPACRKRLREEIRHADSSSSLSSPVQYTETTSLPYTSAVISEALRIHPSTGLILERYVPPGGTVLHNHFIPEGTVIGVNCWVLNRDESIFGRDAREFRPERWIDGDPETIKEMKRCMFTFSAGSRNCIGKNMAMMQIAKVVVELYRHFDIELANPGREWKVSGGWLTRQTDMDMVLSF